MFAGQTGQLMDYQAMLVDPTQFKQVLINLPSHGVRGANITLPFKEEAYKHATTTGQAATLAGAANTLSFSDNGEIRADNTDGKGLVQDLTHNLNIPISASRVLLVGAGGGARGVLGPLLDQGPEQLVIANRTEERAQQLALAFVKLGPVQFRSFDALKGMQFDLIINATSAGLSGLRAPLPDGIVSPSGACYDMIYGPGAEPFLNWAAQQGVNNRADGTGMLVEQAAESFTIWRGTRPDTRPVINALKRQT